MDRLPSGPFAPWTVFFQDRSPRGPFASGTVRPVDRFFQDRSPRGPFASGTVRPVVRLPLGLFTPWTVCLQDRSPLGPFAFRTVCPTYFPQIREQRVSIPLQIRSRRNSIRAIFFIFSFLIFSSIFNTVLLSRTDLLFLASFHRFRCVESVFSALSVCLPPHLSSSPSPPPPHTHTHTFHCFRPVPS